MRPALARILCLLLVTASAGCDPAGGRGAAPDRAERARPRLQDSPPAPSHGAPARSRGVLATLPEVGEGALVHRSGINFPEQVGPLRRVRAYQTADGGRGAAIAEYVDGSGRLRISASVRDRAGRSAAERYEELRAEVESDGGASLPPAGGEPDAPVVAGASAADEQGGGLVTSYRVETYGSDLLEYRATYPASRRVAGAETFARFQSDLTPPGPPPTQP
jgi:hypothetical protein